MQPTLVIMAICSVQSPKGVTFFLHMYILPEICPKFHLSVGAFQTSEKLQMQQSLERISVDTQTVPATENLTKPEAAHGLGHLWIKFGPWNLSSLLNSIEDWDYVCFTAVWATSQWPWDQPWGQFCHFLICWHMPWIGAVAQLWLLQGNAHLSPAHSKGFTRRALRPQAPFLTHNSPPFPSGFSWEASLQQQLLPLVVKLPTTKRTKGTGDLISKINAEKNQIQKNAVPIWNKSSVAFRCSMAGEEKSPC